MLRWLQWLQWARASRNLAICRRNPSGIFLEEVFRTTAHPHMHNTSTNTPGSAFATALFLPWVRNRPFSLSRVSLFLPELLFQLDEHDD